MHKLIINPRSAKTACGLKVTAFYSHDNSGAIDTQIEPMTTNDKDVTCKRCKDAMK